MQRVVLFMLGSRLIQPLVDMFHMCVHLLKMFFLHYRYIVKLLNVHFNAGFLSLYFSFYSLNTLLPFV